MRDSAENAGEADRDSRSGSQSAPEKPSVGPLTIIFSVLASFFGVQNEANRKRDFEGGNIWHFIIAGLVLTLLFMLGVWGAVQYMLTTTPGG